MHQKNDVNLVSTRFGWDPLSLGLSEVTRHKYESNILSNFDIHLTIFAKPAEAQK